MKKILSTAYLVARHLENRWATLSLRKQQKTIVLLFTGYFCLSIIVIFKACSIGVRNPIALDHIENPMIKKQIPGTKADSLTQLFKNHLYENK